MKSETQAALGRLKTLMQIERSILRALYHNKVGDYHYWVSKRKEAVKGDK